MLAIRSDSPTIARERTRQQDRDAARDRYFDLRSRLPSYYPEVERARAEWWRLCDSMYQRPDPEPIKGSTDFQFSPTCHIALPEIEDWLFDEGMPELVTDDMFFHMTGRRVNWRGRDRG